MKLILVLNLFFNCFCIVLSHQISSLLTPMLSQIVLEVFVNRSEEFDVLVFENETEYFREVVNKVIKKTEIPLKILKVQNPETIIKLNQSAILLFKTLNLFQVFLNSSLLYNEYPKSFHFIVYIEDLVHFNWAIDTVSFFVMHSSFIYEALRNEIYYLVIVDSSLGAFCREKEPVAINSFIKNTRKWYMPNFFRGEKNDFKGCELTIGISLPEPIIFDEGKVAIDGYGKIIIDEIAKSLNIQCYFYGINEHVKNRYGNVPDLWDVFILASSLRKTDRLKKSTTLFIRQAKKYPAHATFPFTSVDTVVLISQPALYTQFEKNILPFQIEVWVLLISTLMFAAGVIAVMKFTPRSQQQFVFGSRVSTPGLNLL